MKGGRPYTCLIKLSMNEPVCVVSLMNYYDYILKLVIVLIWFHKSVPEDFPARCEAPRIECRHVLILRF